MLDNQKSRYAKTYRFFQDKIAEFLNEYASYFAYLPTRILNNCILLPIEAESQDTALRIFSTLNDRGKPLSDTDIFKAQFYKYYSEKGMKDGFMKRWKDLEVICDDIFPAPNGSSMDELFTRYMYYERAKQGNKNTTTEALRKFYERDKYVLLKNDNTLDNLEKLADFWRRVARQDDSFSERVLRRLFVLNYAPNGMWTYLVSVYFMKYGDENGVLDDDSFYGFLNRIIGFIWAYALARPGVNALRSPAYPEMINIVNGIDVEFKDYRFEENAIRNMLNSFAITKSMLAWWAFEDNDQTLIKLETVLEIEHIYPKKRQENEKALKEKDSLESLGNKALLEKSVNIRASDYKFEDKKKYYRGFINDKGKEKARTQIDELYKMADEKDDYTEADIISRKKLIIDRFIDYLKKNSLIV